MHNHNFSLNFYKIGYFSLNADKNLVIDKARIYIMNDFV
jgi:hypothetical protein